VKKITEPPQISNSDLANIKSMAVRKYVDKEISVEQVWWDTCFYALIRMGYEVIDPKSDENNSRQQEP
jgi:hypothetical protein